MPKNKEIKDKHFPAFALNNPFRKLVTDPKKFCSYVKEGQVVADLGCGPGYFTIPIAKMVGPKGMVYAVDSDEKVIRVVKKKARKRGLDNIKAYAQSASELDFIEDESVDFILAEGLLCSMAPKYHEKAVSEVKRILKPDGLAYLSAVIGSPGYVEKNEWERTLEGFVVKDRNEVQTKDDGWAVVMKKQ